LEIYFRFRFRPFARHLHIILHQAIPNFVQIEASTAEIWRHIHFSRWRPRRLNTTSGFVAVDVTAFRRSKSISKPNFVEITQMKAKIFFMAIQNGLGRGQIFFQNQECVNILGCSVTFYEYKNVFLMLVDYACTILHQATALYGCINVTDNRLQTDRQTDLRWHKANVT